MVWSTQFEANPSGSDFGYSMGSGLRDTKSEFKTRMQQEHTFDESASATMSHIAGECQVVGISDGGVTDSDVPHALEYDPDSKVLYRNTGGSLEPANTVKKDEDTFSHGDLQGLGDDDHPQYFLVDGSEELNNAWKISAGYAIVNVDSQENPATNTEVMTQAHLNDSPSGGMKHPDDIVNLDNVGTLGLGTDKLKIKEATIDLLEDVIGGSYPASLTKYRVDLAQYAFFPVADTEEIPIFCYEGDYQDDFVGRFWMFAGDGWPSGKITYDYLVETM